jgi:hypothetical protein|tara:strand:- start:865 stop:1071 length:207 start_codon:yes stop_codon:yes gene_type:complete
MTTVTLDEVEYTIEDFTDEAKKVLNLVQHLQSVTGTHQLNAQCTDAMLKVKVAELKQLLTGEEAPSDD